jgi:Rieske Fe-S protein
MAASCTRRTLLRGLAAGTACGTMGCWRSVDGNQTPDARTATDGGNCGELLCLSLTDPNNAALKTIGGAITIMAPAAHDTLVVIRTSDTAVTALSDVCTHRGCVMAYNATSKLLVCPCHGSEFDLTGNVVRGPAVTNVKVYTATLDTTANTIDVK